MPACRRMHTSRTGSVYKGFRSRLGAGGLFMSGAKMLFGVRAMVGPVTLIFTRQNG
jgi:hypothetical protein